MKQIRLYNKAERPLNILEKENKIHQQCEKIEKKLPIILEGFYKYLKASVLPQTRLAYLKDISFFLGYVSLTKKIPLSSGEILKSIDEKEVNNFLDYCRHYVVETEKTIIVYKNQNISLARKKSSICVLFKFLYRHKIVNENIVDLIDPIRIPKRGEREVKALWDKEVFSLLEIIETGEGLTRKQQESWSRTKRRDKAILMLFITYGLRLSELQQLNLSSINFIREEFKIYRKGGKESIMPLNQSAKSVLLQYIEEERKLLPCSEDEDALFISIQNRRITERQIGKLVKKYTAVAMNTTYEKGYSPHKLRATAATSLIGRGNSIYDVQLLLDHEQVTTTQLYSAHRKNVKQELVNAMEWGLECKTTLSQQVNNQLFLPNDERKEDRP